jgi:hypothetical protein
VADEGVVVSISGIDAVERDDGVGRGVGKGVGGTGVGGTGVGGTGVGKGVGSGDAAGGDVGRSVDLSNGLNQNIHSGEVANTCPFCTTATVQRHSPSLSAGKSVVLLQTVDNPLWISWPLSTWRTVTW